ncbi:hypothetical protein SADUNF_Sadunf13G0119500 [Salix dunnii]|uniref:Uncharacterized protein n=1 Tax=Salix dunnii TaxID=1413687 RepID=A0A835JGR6_9ROSI|nr:hypothetical protein SADUNF_Sadunf13G0119500 [Salix dunnii]
MVCFILSSQHSINHEVVCGNMRRTEISPANDRGHPVYSHWKLSYASSIHYLLEIRKRKSGFD